MSRSQIDYSTNLLTIDSAVQNQTAPIRSASIAESEITDAAIYTAKNVDLTFPEDLSLNTPASLVNGASSPVLKRSIGELMASNDQTENTMTHIDDNDQVALRKKLKVEKESAETNSVSLEESVLIAPQEESSQIENSLISIVDDESSFIKSLANVNESKQEDLKELVEEAENELASTRDIIQKSLDSWTALKLKEIELEENLILSGKHPDYIQSLQDIEKRHYLKAKQNQVRFDSCVAAKTEEYRCYEDYANETLRFLRLEQSRLQISKINETISALKKKQIAAGGFSGTPEMLHANRKELLESVESGNRSDINLPEWARRAIRSRLLAGYSQIAIPSFCDGLEDNETEEDINFLRLLIDNQKGQILE